MNFIGLCFSRKNLISTSLNLDCMLVIDAALKKFKRLFGALKISNYVKSSTNSTNLCREGQKISTNNI